MSKPPAISVKSVHKSYQLGRQELHVLRDVDCTVAQGEFVSIVGASGSGKSTLLHLVGLLDRADKGHIALAGQDVSGLSSKSRNRIRRHDVGFVFQFYHLFSELNVLDNAMLPAMVDIPLLKWLSRRKDRRAKAIAVLDEVGLADRPTRQVARPLRHQHHILDLRPPDGRGPAGDSVRVGILHVKRSEMRPNNIGLDAGARSIE